MGRPRREYQILDPDRVMRAVRRVMRGDSRR